MDNTSNYMEERVINSRMTFTDNTTKFIKMKLSKSTIDNAGLGCFTLCDIPRGTYGKYIGIRYEIERENGDYTWVINEYNLTTGKTISNKPVCYIDSIKPKYGNWTRYVNCGLTDDDNNIDTFQSFDKLYYKANRDIFAGEELFTDYGIEYRNKLGIKYDYN